MSNDVTDLPPHLVAARQRDTVRRKKAFLRAYKKSLGNIAGACQKAGVARTTYQNWMNSDPEFELTVADMNEMRLDVVENKVMTAIINGDMGTARWYLDRKGKDRGYGQEVTLNNNHKGLSYMSDAALEKIARGVDGEPYADDGEDLDDLEADDWGDEGGEDQEGE